MLASLVPQIFYDLIARVIPGVVLFITGYLCILGPREAIRSMISVPSNQNPFNFTMILLAIILSYVLGFILSELWSSTFGKIKNKKAGEKTKKQMRSCLAEYDRMRKFLGGHELDLRYEGLPSIYAMHDHLRLYSVSEAYRLLKLQAEERLCEVLFIGFILLAIINPCYYFAEGFLLDRALLEVALLVAIYSFWRSGDKLEKFFINGTCKSWLFFSFPIGPTPSTRKEKLKSS